MLTFIIIYFVEDENGQSTNFSPHSKQFSPIVRALLEYISNWILENAQFDCYQVFFYK